MRSLLATLPVLAALLAGAMPAAAQKLPDRIESPVLFFPADVEPSERKVDEGKVFLSIPLRWAFAGKLERDVDVVAGEFKVTLAAGELLPQALIPKDGKLEGGRFLFCTRNKVVEERQGTGLVAQLVDSLRDSLRDAQFCVEDTNADGKVDRSVVLGKDKDEIVGASFEPVGVTELTNQLIPGEGDRVDITLNSVGDKRTRLLVNLWQAGGPRPFDTMQSGRFYAEAWPTFEHKNGFPASVTVFGVKLSILTAERTANTATLGWRAAARPGEFVAIPRVTNVTFRY